MRLARAAAASGAMSSPAPAAGSPSGRANVNMSEAEGGWLHETALEASSSEASAKPVSVPEPGVTLPQRTRYAVSPQKGSKAVTMAHFFARDLARAPTANFSVRYSMSLTVGVKKKKIIPCSRGPKLGTYSDWGLSSVLVINKHLSHHFVTWHMS